MSKKERIVRGFFSSVGIHVALLSLLALFGLFTLPVNADRHFDVVLVDEAQKQLVPVSQPASKPKTETAPVRPKKVVTAQKIEKDDITEFNKNVTKQDAHNSNKQTANKMPDTGSKPAGNITGNASVKVNANDKAAAIERFVRTVERNKGAYPYMALRQNKQGVAYIYVKLDEAGSISSHYLANSSGDKSLDEAAMKAVKNTCPFSHGLGESLAMTVPVRWMLN